MLRGHGTSKRCRQEASCAFKVVEEINIPDVARDRQEEALPFVQLVMNWEVGFDIYTLLILCIKQVTNENLL